MVTLVAQLQDTHNSRQ